MIWSVSANKYYIGRAFNLDARWKTHRSALNRNKHPNEYLQNAWNKYGEQDFKFYILEFVEHRSIIIEREQYWIDKLNACDRSLGFNLNPSAANSLGYKHSAEVKEIIRQNSIRLGLKPPSPVGRKHSEASKVKMSLASRGKPKSDSAKRNMKNPKSEKHKKALSLARTGYKHSEADKLKRSLAAKAKSSWPHENGNKCKCDECRSRRNAYYRNKKYPRNRNKQTA